MLRENERDELESAGFTITNCNPPDAAASVTYPGTEDGLRHALPRGWQAIGVKGFMDDPTTAMLERQQGRV